jgi:hypothetical protein
VFNRLYFPAILDGQFTVVEKLNVKNVCSGSRLDRQPKIVAGHYERYIPTSRNVGRLSLCAQVTAREVC